VDDASGARRTFKKFEDAAAFALVMSTMQGGTVDLDVLCWSKAAAKVWGGDDAVQVYLDDPDA